MSRVAAVDIGTNSTRLLVGDDRRTTVTRLGQGVDRTGRLDPVGVLWGLGAAVGVGLFARQAVELCAL